MKVFKFGGASIKDAPSVKNMSDIIASNSKDSLVIVVSAMDKTTNSLEKVHFLWLNDGNFYETLAEKKQAGNKPREASGCSDIQHTAGYEYKELR